MTRSRNYIGWVVIEEASPGYNPMVKVEYNSKADGKRHSKEMGYGGSGCIEAIEFFDMQAGQTVKLEPTIKGCYRVYIQEEESK